MGGKIAKRDFPKPPGHLSAEARKWWAGVVEVFELEPWHLLLLTKAAEAWDRAEGARRELAEKGTTYTDRFGAPRTMPQVAIERDSRLAFCRVLRELALDVEPPASKPPSLPGRR